MNKRSLNQSRKCTAIKRDGRKCRAWAVRDSDPPQCSAHGGYSVGAGAPVGNRNAVKHGYYARGLRPEEIEQLEAFKVRGLMGELVLARVTVMRLMDFVKRASCTAAEALPVMKYVFIGLRTIAYLEERIGDVDEALWKEVLREVKMRRAGIGMKGRLDAGGRQAQRTPRSR